MEHEAHQHRRHGVDRPRRVGAGELLVEDRLLHGRELRAAVLRGPAGAEKAGFVQAALPFAHGREVTALVAFGRVLFDPRRDAGAKRFFFWGVGQIHLGPLLRNGADYLPSGR